MKRIVLSAIVAFALSNAFATTRLEIVNAPAKTINQMMTAVLQQQQKPYEEGATGEDAFGETGLIVYAYSQLGITLPNNLDGLTKIKTKVKKAKDLKEGDLVFFSNKENKKIVEHVGIVQLVKENNFNFYYVSKEKGVLIGNSEDEQFRGLFMNGANVITDKALDKFRKEHQKDSDAVTDAIAKQTAAANALEAAKVKLQEAENAVNSAQTKLETNGNMQITF